MRGMFLFVVGRLVVWRNVVRRIGVRRVVLRTLILAAALVFPTSASAQEPAAWVPVPGASAGAADEFVLPGVLLLASTREQRLISGRADRHRLYALDANGLRRVAHPEEELGPASAALARDGRRVLVDAGGQRVYLVSVDGADRPAPIGPRLPPVSFVQTDTYLSVGWPPNQEQVLLARPAPAGLTLVSLADGAAWALPFLGSRPSFSPDGRTMALVYRQEGEMVASIYVAAADGSQAPVKLTGDDLYETLPAWLNDTEVAYVAASEPWELRAWDTASGGKRLITRLPAGYLVSDLVAAPGGAWVAYTYEQRGTLRRTIRLATTSGPAQQYELGQDDTWNDRVLDWANPG